MQQYQTRAQRVFMVFNYAILITASLLCLLPFIHMLAVSLSASAPVSAKKVFLWPVDFTLESYKFAFSNGKFIPAFWVSIKKVVLGVAVNLLLVALTAYPLSKSKEKLMGRAIYMTFFIITMIIGGGLIPMYIIVTKYLHLKDNILAMILPGAFSMGNMLILMNFIRGLPEELEESAMLDGAKAFTILFRILLPLLTPSLATIGLFNVVGHWNDWFSGMIYMSDPKNYPLQTYLRNMLRSMEQIIRTSNNDYEIIAAMLNARTGRAAQLFLGMLPVLLVYPFLQKYFTTGLVIGSVKG